MYHFFLYQGFWDPVMTKKHYHSSTQASHLHYILSLVQAYDVWGTDQNLSCCEKIVLAIGTENIISFCLHPGPIDRDKHIVSGFTSHVIGSRVPSDRSWHERCECTSDQMRCKSNSGAGMSKCLWSINSSFISFLFIHFIQHFTRCKHWCRSISGFSFYLLY